MLGRRIPVGKLFGFEIAIDTSWFFLAFLITWSLSVAFFPSNYPALPAATYWIMGVIGALGLFVSVLLHELSHSLVARHHGLSISGITLFLFGGVAQMEGEPREPKTELQMAAVGPLVSVVLGGLFYAFLQASRSLGMPVAVQGVLGYLSTINLVLAAFNLIPAFPLDGGRVLRAALWKWKNDFVGASRTASHLGVLFGWALAVLGGLSLIRGDFFGGMWWVLIGFFLRDAARLSYQQVLVEQALQGVTVEHFMTRKPVVVPPGITIQTFVDEYLYRYHHKMFPVGERNTLLGCMHLADLKKIPTTLWRERTVADVQTPCSSENTVTPRTGAEKALKLMSRSGQSRLLVAEGNCLYGIVTLKDMMKSLALRLELSGSVVPEAA